MARGRPSAPQSTTCPRSPGSSPRRRPSGQPCGTFGRLPEFPTASCGCRPEPRFTSTLSSTGPTATPSSAPSSRYPTTSASPPKKISISSWQTTLCSSPDGNQSPSRASTSTPWASPATSWPTTPRRLKRYSHRGPSTSCATSRRSRGDQTGFLEEALVIISLYPPRSLCFCAYQRDDFLEELRFCCLDLQFGGRRLGVRARRRRRRRLLPPGLGAAEG
mmetsp:Transcript_18606/g.64063  ORF Transcript_18606/g.64063 Transcript_18606/m.64063 type:complete len:219 (-) Transcript_18606:106-762(-)